MAFKSDLIADCFRERIKKLGDDSDERYKPFIGARNTEEFWKQVDTNRNAPPRILECLVQPESRLVAERPLDQSGPLEGFLTTFEMRVHRIYVEESIRMDGHANRIDPSKWRSLIFCFQQFHGLSGQVHESKMGEIPETLYRTTDTEDRQQQLVAAV